MAEQRRDPGTGGNVVTSSTGIAPPPPPPPAPKKKTPLSKGAAYQTWLKAHPTMRAYEALIWKWANQYGLDPTYFAALIWEESGGDPKARSDKNAYGLSQAHLPTWAGKRLPWGDVVTEKWLENPNNALRFGAWYFGQQLEKYGTYEDAYRKGYNNGYTGPSVFRSVPTGYGPKTGALSPTEAASTSAERAAAAAAAKQRLSDPWVTVDKTGKVKFKFGDTPPKNALLYDGLPITKSQFLGARRQLEDTWVSYTGKRPTNEQVANFLKKGWSTTTLARSLSQTKDFWNSPVYKSFAPAANAASAGLLAPGETVDRDLIREAILNNWSGEVIQKKLRERPGYLRSTDFKGKATSLLNVYMSIYGVPDDPQEMAAIKEATLGGWSMDQFAGWLRSRPEYTRSSEFQAKAVNFFSELGLIMGQVPVLRPGQAPKNTMPNTSGPLPDDKRVTGPSGVDPDNKLAVSYGG